MLLTFPVHNCWHNSGKPLALQHGVWSKPFVRQLKVSAAHGAQIIKSVISAVSAKEGSHSLLTQVLCAIPLLAQQLFMSGNFGASPTVVVFIFPGVNVKLLIEYDGKLEPCVFNAFTVTSYIVNGIRLFTIVSFWFDGTLICTVWDVVVAASFFGSISDGSIKCSSKVFSDVTLIA